MNSLRIRCQLYLYNIIRLAKLDRAEAQIWRAITVLVEDHQAAQRRLDEETRYMGRLESAITTLLEGLTD